MKNFFLISLFSIIFSAAHSQTKKTIYFLADTTNIPKEKKTLDIMWTTPFHYSFVFYSNFKAPYYNHLEFSYLVDKKNPKPKIELKRPRYAYTNLKELLDVVKENLLYFNDNYDFYITEVIPGSKYRTSKVLLMRQSAPIVDGVTLKDKQ